MVLTVALTAIGVGGIVLGLYLSVANPVHFIILWRGGTWRDSAPHLVIASVCKHIAWQLMSAAVALVGLWLVVKRIWPTEVETITFWIGALIFLGLSTYVVGVISEKPPWSRQ